ncbi:MAG TPA: hypothetical protein VGF59_24495, partial [Bryobacteraceae bacterium]
MGILGHESGKWLRKGEIKLWKSQTGEGESVSFGYGAEPHTPFFRKRLKKIDTQARVASLQRAMDKVLSGAAGIRQKRWWT